jgi:uncharacterized protein
LTPGGEAGLNYLCAGLRAYFGHVDPYMRTMAGLLSQGRPANEIMDILRMEEAKPADRFVHAERNDPCPCGSGRKYKKCHGAAYRQAAVATEPGGLRGRRRPRACPTIRCGVRRD